MAAYLDARDKEVATAPVEGAITFRPRGYDVTEPDVGTALNPDAARDALVAASSTSTPPRSSCR